MLRPPAVDCRIVDEADFRFGQRPAIDGVNSLERDALCGKICRALLSIRMVFSAKLMT